MTHRATCHCGAVELAVDLTDGLTSASRCDLTLYQWNTKTAKHWFCKTCGIYTHHQRRSNPNEYGVNAACIEGVNPRDLGPVPWTDGINHPSDET